MHRKILVIVLSAGLLLGTASISQAKLSKAQALAKLDKKCEEGKTTIKAYAKKAHQMLMEAGLWESKASVLRHVNKSIPKGYNDMNCADVFAVYVTLRRGY